MGSKKARWRWKEITSKNKAQEVPKNWLEWTILTAQLIVIISQMEFEVPKLGLHSTKNQVEYHLQQNSKNAPLSVINH